MTSLEADHYRNEIADLESDHIVIEMVKDIRDYEAEHDCVGKHRALFHDDDLTEPTFEAMSLFNYRYHEVCGTECKNNSLSLGGVAKAVGALLHAGGK
jgi:hypothetical protein